MKSIVLTAPGILRMTDVQPPEGPGRDEAQVRIHKVGICGTDLHAFQGNQPFFTYPRVLGHELAVEITAIGPTDLQHNLQVGDRCCIRPYLNCGTCGPCRRGFANACANIQVLGVHRDGGMCEQINVPLDKLHKSSVQDSELALVEMLSIGAHAVNRARLVPSDVALVVGVGPIGLSVSLFARQAGAHVIVMDINEARLKFAQTQLGIKDCINAQQKPIEQLEAISPDGLPTAVLDATGSPRSMAQAFNYAAHGGRLVFVGLFQGDVTFNDPDFHKRELSLLASRNATAQDFEHVIQTLEAGDINVQPWITHTLPEAMIKDFPSWLEPDTSVVKAMMSFN